MKNQYLNYWVCLRRNRAIRNYSILIEAKLFVRESGSDRYLVFKTAADEDVWKIVDQYTPIERQWFDEFKVGANKIIVEGG